VLFCRRHAAARAHETQDTPRAARPQCIRDGQTLNLAGRIIRRRLQRTKGSDSHQPSPARPVLWDSTPLKTTLKERRGPLSLPLLLACTYIRGRDRSTRSRCNIATHISISFLAKTTPPPDVKRKRRPFSFRPYRTVRTVPYRVPSAPIARELVHAPSALVTASLPSLSRPLGQLHPT
jgi:hypothetical protein